MAVRVGDVEQIERFVAEMDAELAGKIERWQGLECERLGISLEQQRVLMRAGALISEAFGRPGGYGALMMGVGKWLAMDVEELA